MSRYVRPSGDGPEYTDVLKAQVERLTAELAEHQKDRDELITQLQESEKDAERLDWLLCRVSGKEYRRIGIEYSAGCLRADIDAAMEAKP